MAVGLARFDGAFVPKVTNPLDKDRGGWLRRYSRRSVFRWALRRARLVLTLSDSAAERIAEADPRLAKRTRVVHNPYVSDRMLRAAADRQPADPPMILAIGRLSEQKNHALLLRAAARLTERDWRLRICGDGPEEGALRPWPMTSAWPIADARGFIADPLPEYLAAKVMALPSRWEGLPATALEAIACGCPVVATASSQGLVDLLAEVGARPPVALGDEAGLAEALRAALDGELPAVPSSAALPYGIEAACDEHAALFAELLGR